MDTPLMSQVSGDDMECAVAGLFEFLTKGQPDVAASLSSSSYFTTCSMLICNSVIGLKQQSNIMTAFRDCTC
jgi:hypothetical protein